MTLKSGEARTGQNSLTASPEAFQAVFREHWPRVYAVLVRLVGDHAEAEDLAQETFWRLYQRGSSDWQDFNLGGWLYRVATNLGLNSLRAWKRRERHELEAGLREAAQSPDDPHDTYAEAEERQHVRQALSEMHPRQSQLLLLRHSGLSYRELAATLGLSPNSIGALLARAEAEFEERYLRVRRET